MQSSPHQRRNKFSALENVQTWMEFLVFVIIDITVTVAVAILDITVILARPCKAGDLSPSYNDWLVEGPRAEKGMFQVQQITVPRLSVKQPLSALRASLGPICAAELNYTIEMLLPRVALRMKLWILDPSHEET